MNLWFSVHFLFAGLYLSSSAPTPEECKHLVTPLSLGDLNMLLNNVLEFDLVFPAACFKDEEENLGLDPESVLYGRMNFIMGYNDHEMYNSILKVTDSSWLKITPSPYDANGVLMSQENKINGTCFGSIGNVTIQGNTATISVANITSSFHVLKSCNDCLIFSINSTARNPEKLLALMKLNSNITEETVRAFYLFSRESTVKDSDLEYTKQQASCLGFTGEPGFHYHPNKEFCAEGEGIRILT